MFWLGVLFFLVVSAEGRAQSLPPETENWDATTLDIYGEQKSLAGIWEYVPWEDLSKVPEFNDAQLVQVPVAHQAGAYRRKFSIAHEGGTSRSILRFEAVAFRCAVFINGREVGGHAGGMTPFEIDVTDAVRQGGNELIVLVLGAKGRALSSEASSAALITYNERGQALASGGDKTVLGGGMFPADGIRQGVFLREVPLIRVADATLVTSFREKQLTACVNLANQTLEQQSVVVQLDVLPYDIESKTIGEKPIWTKSEKVMAQKGLTTLELIQPWSDPQLWMPGDPHLYVARIRVEDVDGKSLSERNVRFGFREVWLDGRQIMLNGKPFRAFVHGTIATEASPGEVRAMFKEVMASGSNMVRPHTRPPLPFFTQIADEMGVAIIGEGELTFNSNHAYEEPVFWSNFIRTHRERIARDKNHPSILVWSLANEVIISSPGQKIGQHFYDAFQELRKVDPTRPFMQEGDGDLRDMLPEAKGFPIDIINLHPYDVSPTKNPLWATEFPPIAWALESIGKPQEMPATNKFGSDLPDRNRPWFVGEFGLAVAAAYPDFYSFWTGPQAYRNLFGDANELVRALGEITVIQLQAFRDMGMAGMDPWDMPDKPALAPFLKRGQELVAVFSRDLYGHWTGGENASRKLVVLNDSFENQKLTLTIALKKDGQELNRKEESLVLQPGEKRQIGWEYLMPEVEKRTPVEFIVELRNDEGKQISGFQQGWLVYPEIFPVRSWQEGMVWLCGSESSLGALAKWSGAVVRSSLIMEELFSTRPELVILDQKISDDLTADDRAALEKYVEEGGVVTYIGAGQLPFSDEVIKPNGDSDATRLFTLRENSLTEGTTSQDWEFWRPDHFVSRGNYPMIFDPLFELPLVAGGRNGPMYAPLVVLKRGKGVHIACRLQINESLAVEPVTRLFLNNLVSYASSLRNEKERQRSELVFVCPPRDLSLWEKRVDSARIPLGQNTGHVLAPGKQIAFLQGSANPTDAQLDSLSKFIEDGGTLWIHGLSPETSYLQHVSSWIGQPITLRTPGMWLQQLELMTPDAPGALLDGINDFITCWATFGWTNGDMRTVRTTRIADYVLSNSGCKGEALLREPAWIGKWNVTPDGYTLSQAILLEIGKHKRNEVPGIGLAVFKVGKGRILIDQLRWDEVILDASSESQGKARYLAGTLWKNMAASGE